MTLAAAWAPDTDALFYPIETMRWANLPVVVTLLGGDRPMPADETRGGFEVLAIVRKHPRRKVWWWYQVGAWGGAGHGWMRSEQIALDMVGRTPPSPKSPTAWRPLDVAAWPHPLPAPLDPSFGPKRPPTATPEAAEALDPHIGDDGWPYPGLVLTLGTPASREECEARVLRAFRTSASAAGGGAIGHAARTMSADIPKEIILASIRLNEAWWSVHPDADGGVFEAVRSGWTPNKRDVGDWVTALGWLDYLEPRAVRVISLRAADPPFSFRQIAERIRVSHHVTAKRIYERAIDAAFASA